MKKTQERAVTDLTRGVIWRQILVFALPFLLSNLLQQFYSTADAAIVGQDVGSGALAAIGSCDKLTYLLINLFVGISTGASVAVSQAFGRKDEESLSKTVHSSIALGLLSGALLMVLGFFVAPVLLVWMDTPADVLPMSVTYIRIYFMGMIPTMVYNMGSGILRGHGKFQECAVLSGGGRYHQRGAGHAVCVGVPLGRRGAPRRPRPFPRCFPRCWYPGSLRSWIPLTG